MKIFCAALLLGLTAFCKARSVRESLCRSRASEAYYAGDFDAAQKYFEQVLVDQPDNTDCLRGLGDSFYAQKNYEQALFYYEQALKPVDSNQDKRELYFNVGCAQAQLRDFAAALKSFERVIELDNTHERAKKNRDILKKLLEEQQKQQQDKKNQNNQDNKQQNDKQKESDQQENKNNENQEKNQDKSEQKKQQKPEDQQNKSQEKKKDDQAHKQQQPEQQNKNGQQKQAPHEQQQSVKESDRKPEEKLGRDMLKLLQQVDKLDQQGQHLYVQAVAGQQANQKRSEHDW